MIIGVAHQESRRSQGQHGDVPVDLVPVEGRLVVNDEVDELLVGEGHGDGVLDEIREVPARLDLESKTPPGVQPHALHPATLRRRPPPLGRKPSV